MKKKAAHRIDVINWTGFEVSEKEHHGFPVGDAIIHRRVKCPCEPTLELIKKGNDNNTICRFYLHKIQDAVSVKENV